MRRAPLPAGAHAPGATTRPAPPPPCGLRARAVRRPSPCPLPGAAQAHGGGGRGVRRSHGGGAQEGEGSFLSLPCSVLAGLWGEGRGCPSGVSAPLPGLWGAAGLQRPLAETGRARPVVWGGGRPGFTSAGRIPAEVNCHASFSLSSSSSPACARVKTLLISVIACAWWEAEAHVTEWSLLGVC